MIFNYHPEAQSETIASFEELRASQHDRAEDVKSAAAGGEASGEPVTALRYTNTPEAGGHTSARLARASSRTPWNSPKSGCVKGGSERESGESGSRDRGACMRQKNLHKHLLVNSVLC